ncbi:hypothetical protein, partial [Pokkaliibacter plantistimulans]
LDEYLEVKALHIGGL